MSSLFTALRALPLDFTVLTRVGYWFCFRREEFLLWCNRISASAGRQVWTLAQPSGGIEVGKTCNSKKKRNFFFLPSLPPRRRIVRARFSQGQQRKKHNPQHWRKKKPFPTPATRWWGRLRTAWLLSWKQSGLGSPVPSRVWNHLKSHIYCIGGSFVHSTSMMHLPFIRKFASDLQLTGLKYWLSCGPCLQEQFGELENCYLMYPDSVFPSW